MPFPSHDVIAVHFAFPNNPFTLFSIYNDGEHDITVDTLSKFREEHKAAIYPSPNAHVVWVGDFNRHHLYWDREEDHHLFTPNALQASEHLLEVVTDWSMHMALPPRIPMHEHYVSKRRSRLDNVFCTEHTAGLLQRCEVMLDDPKPGTDHFPIVSTFDLQVTHHELPMKPDYRLVDWNAYNKELGTRLSDFLPPATIATKTDFVKACANLTKAIQDVTRTVVPLKRPCPFTKRWWSSDLKKLRQSMRRLYRHAHRLQDFPGHPIHLEARTARNKYSAALHKAKQKHWIDWLEKADEPDIWAAHRYIAKPTGDGGLSAIPTLQRETDAEGVTLATTNEEKAHLLAKAFFPPPPPDPLLGADRSSYPTDTPNLPSITKSQIRRHAAKLSPYKAPRPDGIPNIVLTRCIDTILEHVYHIYRAVFDIGVYYEPWQHWNTIVLRKPGKARYDTAKSYRPIALLNTLHKLLTSITAELLIYWGEHHKLLPPMHFGGRPGRTTTDAVHLLAQTVKHAWRNGKVVSALFLDIEGAFPNATTERLLHNMRKRGLPRDFIRFMRLTLEGRQTTLCFDGYVSAPIPINNGIGQGDPGSMPGFNFFNADLLDISKGRKNELVLAFVDNAVLLAIGTDFMQTHAILRDMMTRPGGALQWSKEHNSPFEYSKFALMDFTRNPARAMDSAPLVLPHAIIEPVPTTRYLGIFLDTRLDWKEQCTRAVKKGMEYTLALRRISKHSSGLPPRQLRRLYVAVVIPKMLYGIDVWCQPARQGQKRQVGSVRVVKALSRVQRLGAVTILGGLRSSPTDALEMHANLLPIDLLIDRMCYRAVLRLATLPPYHPLAPIVRRCAAHLPKHHVSTIHYLLHTYQVDPKSMEVIHPVSRHPALQSRIRVSIAKSREDAITEERDIDEGTKIFTDGSGHDGHAGAAAVLLRAAGQHKALRYHLGELTLHTVYESELVGLLLAAELIRRNPSIPEPFHIFLDNQAAIQAPTSVVTRMGQQLAQAIYLALCKPRRPGRLPPEIHLHWIAGHEGVLGNELADEQAKRAASGESSQYNHLPVLLRKALPPNPVALRQEHYKQLKKRWKANWHASPRFPRL